MDNFAQFNQQQMMARPADMGAGGAGIGASFENLLKTLTGAQSTKGLFNDAQGLFGKQIMTWGSQRQQGPFARALQEIRESLTAGGKNLMEGVGPGDIHGQAPGGGDTSQISAPLATPSAGGDAGVDSAYLA